MDKQSQLIAIGTVLYGDRWQTELARDLGHTDGRRVRQWLAGDRPIPDTVWGELAHLLHARKTAIANVLSDFYGISEDE